MRENRGAVRRARNHLATPPPRVVVVRVPRKSESEGCRAKELRIDGRRITSEDTYNDLDMNAPYNANDFFVLVVGLILWFYPGFEGNSWLNKKFKQ